MAVGIKDVARAAGVSAATVSRVLSGRKVDAEMRTAVEAAVIQTGYRPNMAARRLRSKHNSTIGLVVADIRNPFFTAVSRTIEEVAYANGLRVILCNTDENPEKEEMYLQLMQDERVTGVIIAASREGVDRIAATRYDFPLVLIDRAGAVREHDAVVLDNAAAAGMLVDHLHGRGFTRIGAFYGPTTTGYERQLGYIAAMTARGLVPQAHCVGPGKDTVAEAISAMKAAGVPPPEAIIATNGVMLMGLVRGVIAHDLRVPDDITLVGFDNEPWTEIFAGGMTVVEQPVDEIGRQAMTMLLDRLQHPDASARKMLLSARLIARDTRPAPR
ncbi:LacI family DNA-binding transcriptional regulator [Sphingomonas sp. PB2P12]|uniref:LacI family DNA-binding transcriptional regulator n=1 Tax=Sphingomonas sandaracina TaxID=3096157 RepID=UPI002FC89970